MAKYTREQLIFYLVKLGSAIKRSPTQKDMDASQGMPSSGTYIRRFGSWNRALKAAGLKLNARKEYNREELAENMKQLFKELGHAPKSKDLVGKSWTASYSTYKKYFGSWGNALRAAKIPDKKLNSLSQYSKKK